MTRLWLAALLLGACDGKDTKPDTTAAESDADADADADTDTDTDVVLYHPDGFDDPVYHGQEAKHHVQTCTDCHGADLAGSGDAVSCDSCHEKGWRTDCTFCHGGTDNNTGAPPLDLNNSKDDAAFGAHSKHVEETIHAAFSCEQCHTVPDDVLSAGHLFDKTPAVAEVTFSAGLSAAASWSGKTCTDAYCHGTGQGDDGTVTVGDGPVACGSCHASAEGPNEAWWTMSGEHTDHLRHDISCESCHADTVSRDGDIISPALHVNGTADFVPEHDTITYNGETCDGVCHNERHRGRSWER